MSTVDFDDCNQSTKEWQNYILERVKTAINDAAPYSLWDPDLEDMARAAIKAMRA